jgi:hypothetical protein
MSSCPWHHSLPYPILPPFAPPLRSRIEYSKVKPEVCEGYKKQKAKKWEAGKGGSREYKNEKKVVTGYAAPYSAGKKVKISKSKGLIPPSPRFLP